MTRAHWRAGRWGATGCSELSTSSHGTGSLKGLAGRRLEVELLELEAFIEEAGGNAAPAGEGETGAAPEERGSELGHDGGGWQTEAAA